MRVWKHDIALLALFTLAVWAIYFSYPPYVVPASLCGISAIITALYIGVRFFLESRKNDDRAFLKVIVRLFFGVLLLFAEMTRNAFE